MIFRQLATILLLLAANYAIAGTDEEIQKYLDALQSRDYQAAALVFAYPDYPSPEDLTARQQYVTDTITRYHATLGTLEQAPTATRANGLNASFTIGGGDEEFTMLNPPTQFRRVSTEFSGVGPASITFMLAEQGDGPRIIYLQYDYLAP